VKDLVKVSQYIVMIMYLVINRHMILVITMPLTVNEDFRYMVIKIYIARVL